MPKVDVNFFKPFVEGTLLTLKVQCSLDSQPGKPFSKESGPPVVGDIAAIIGLASAAFKGNIGLVFPKAVFLALMSNMLGETFTEITVELQDGVAELLNIIFGHAKRVLNDQGYDIEKAIPSIIRGANISITHLTKAAIIVLPFVTEKGTFFIEIAFDK